MTSHAVSILLSAVAAITPAADAKLPASLDLTAVRGLVTQHDGRWPPLDTVARDHVESVTGNAFYQGSDPVLWLLAWTFDANTWMHEPLIPIRSEELRGEIGLSATQTTFSFSELVGHEQLRSLIEDLANVEQGRKLDPLEAKVSDINGKLIELQTVFRGQAIRLLPSADDALGAWRPVGRTMHGAETPPGEAQVREAWGALASAFLADDSTAFAAASQQLVDATAALPAAHRPTPAQIATELRYNKLQPFSVAWKIMLAGAALAALAIFVRMRAFDALAFVGMLGGFVVLTYGLSLRWQIAGRIPASNMYESLLFLSWGMGAFAIISVLVFRDRLIPLTASGMGALALVLADVLPMDHFVRPIVPVLLDTVWMSIHVPIIMVSYSVLALAMLIAHVQLVAMALGQPRSKLTATMDGLHYWYVHVGSILLTAGIITGSMWGASSWGRYWGWDPKEVWSLIAALGYLTILHVQIDRERTPRWAYFLAAVLSVAVLVIVVPKLAPLTGVKMIAIAGMVAGIAVFVLARGMFAAAAKSIICFWLIIMTYLGVNYVLGTGLHSYGFGTGAMVKYMLLTGGIDLGFVTLFTIIYVARRSAEASSEGDLPVAARA